MLESYLCCMGGCVVGGGGGGCIAGSNNFPMHLMSQKIYFKLLTLRLCLAIYVGIDLIYYRNTQVSGNTQQK